MGSESPEGQLQRPKPLTGLEPAITEHLSCFHQLITD